MDQCEIIQDLLPLYKDKVVSASSIEMIEEHIETCENCKGELAKLQSEVKVRFSPTQKAEIGAFRLFKKRLLRRNVVIAFLSVVLGIALVLGTYVYLDNTTTIIPYVDGLIVDVRVDSERNNIDIISKTKTDGASATNITIKENGENVRLVFMNFSESIISKWQNSRDGELEYAFRVVAPHARLQSNPEDKPDAYIHDEPFNKCEIYYINDAEINPEKDYARLRQEGVLVWSGTLE